MGHPKLCLPLNRKCSGHPTVWAKKEKGCRLP
jgi:hypothetical protein